MRVRAALLATVVVGGLTWVGAGAQEARQSGLDRTAFDAAVRPQDDLFHHVNGGWLRRTEIPADRPIYGTFIELSDRAENDLHAIIQAAAAEPNKAPGSAAQLIGDLYASFMDEAALARLGEAPLRPRLAEIDAVKTTGELAALLGRLSMVGVPGPVDVFLEADAGNPDVTAAYLSQAGTALPDRDYYLSNDPRLTDIRDLYRAYLQRVFSLAGRANPAGDARLVMNVETSLARAQWTLVESRDAVKTFNKYPLAKLAAEMPGFDWMGWARPQGLDRAAEWVISQPSFFAAFAGMVPTTPLEAWKAWVAAQVITRHAPLLAPPFQDAWFDFFGRTLSGQPEPRERWRRAVQFVNGTAGDALGRLYVARHFPETSKARMDELIANLVDAYRESITELDWMTEPTKQAALAKLARFTSKVGYPAKWRDYRGLNVVPTDLSGNADRASRFESEYQLAKLGRPVDRDEWLMTPQTVNAYYNGLKNEIVFPAAILQPPFFNPAADDAVNYGAIGAVIGHEIGHGFDDQGRRYDGEGRLRDWWTSSDEAEFVTRASRLVAQYDRYSPLPGVHVNGELTVGENMGDLGGLSIAHRAWRISLAGRPAAVIDGLTGDQRYFMGWAQVWRAKAREDYLRRQVLADPHAWAEFRVNGPLGHIDAFHEAFNVRPGDALYREPGERVRIW
jgi:predicted metalloendopeptidase